MKTAIIYARHLETRKNEKNIQQQLLDCKEYAIRNKYKIKDIYWDYLLNKQVKPINFEQVVKEMQSNDKDTLIMCSINILGRNTREIMQFIKMLTTHNKRLILLDQEGKRLLDLQEIIKELIKNENRSYLR